MMTPKTARRLGLIGRLKLKQELRNNPSKWD
jgi:hypothetical protein